MPRSMPPQRHLFQALVEMDKDGVAADQRPPAYSLQNYRPGKGVQKERNNCDCISSLLAFCLLRAASRPCSLRPAIHGLHFGGSSHWLPIWHVRGGFGEIAVTQLGDGFHFEDQVLARITSGFNRFPLGSPGIAIKRKWNLAVIFFQSWFHGLPIPHESRTS